MTGAEPAETTMDALAPVVRIVAGSPTDEELAATQAVIAAVLAEQAAAGAARVLPPVDHWSHAARAPRAIVYPGAGAWSASRGQRGC
ncbi:acyl-CoA carboxylase subunit epsilon [Microcella daejeonensis]|uniref:Acyl-CoA carboxylase subunit epsilon n=1 Tax=Microcella daejeonensis TaxID=2994971 RepID=A0A9E8MNC5_9MICO|nr:acyl-CoA carboxylase subunit epsilon [Microcella daejeonensis]WAB81901.1 acyl-CoA carboxylase subunit epsilon [Microcella daejeonensis]